MWRMLKRWYDRKDETVPPLAELMEEGVIRMKLTNVIQKDYDNFKFELIVLSETPEGDTLKEIDLLKALSLWRKLGESVANKCLSENSLPDFCSDLLETIEKIAPFISFETETETTRDDSPEPPE